jgi:hypothetical protein
MKKSLLIPLIPELEQTPFELAPQLIEDKGNRCSIDSLNWAQQYPYHPFTAVNVAHSGKAIYVDFLVRCNYLRAVNYKNNTPVWEDSCVSIFIQPSSDSEYWNFDFNCIGTVNAAHRSSRRPVNRLSDDDISRIERYASCGNKPFREVEGLFTWSVVARIPLDLINVAYQGNPIVMKGNFCKCATGTSQPHFLTWNPISSPQPEFHVPESFGDIILQ